jgi:hypothetical protein
LLDDDDDDAPCIVLYWEFPVAGLNVVEIETKCMRK